MTLDECQQEEAQIRQQPWLVPSKIGFVCSGGLDFSDEKYVLIDGDALYSENVETKVMI